MTFISQSDTPPSFSGYGKKTIQINAAETALEFGQQLDTTDNPTFNDIKLDGKVETGVISGMSSEISLKPNGTDEIAKFTSEGVYVPTDVNLVLGDDDNMSMHFDGTDLCIQNCEGNFFIFNESETGEIALQIGSATDSTKFVLRNVNDDILFEVAGDGKISGPGLSVHGNDFEKFQSLTESETSESTLQSKLDATTASKPVGTYRIAFFCDAANNSGSSTMVEFSVDGQSISTHTSGDDLYSIGMGNVDNWQALSAVHYKELSSASTIDVDIKFSNGTGNTAKISNATIEIWRVS